MLGSSGCNCNCSTNLGQKPVFGFYGFSRIETNPFGSTNLQQSQSQVAFGSHVFGFSSPFCSPQPQHGQSAINAFVFCNTIHTPGFHVVNTPAPFGTIWINTFGPTTSPAFCSGTTPTFRVGSIGNTFGAGAFGTTGNRFNIGPNAGNFGTTTTNTTPSFCATTSTPAFGVTATPTFHSTIAPAVSNIGNTFGAENTPPLCNFGNTFNTGSNASTFGATTTNTTPSFGATCTPAFGVSTTPTFHSTIAPAISSIGNTFGAANTHPSGSIENTFNNCHNAGNFGATSTNTTPSFGATCTPAFGVTITPTFHSTIAPKVSSISNTFAAANTSLFGSIENTFNTGPNAGIFGATSTNTTPSFCATNTPVFSVTTTPTFGSTSTPAVSNIDHAFGAANTPPFGNIGNTFNTGSNAGNFGATSTNATPSFCATSTPAFGVTTTHTFGSTSTPPVSSIDNTFAAANTPPFGSFDNPFSIRNGLNTFGPHTPKFCGVTSSNPTFGNTPAVSVSSTEKNTSLSVTSRAFDVTNTPALFSSVRKAFDTSTAPSIDSTKNTFGATSSTASMFGIETTTHAFDSPTPPKLGSIGNTLSTPLFCATTTSTTPTFGVTNTLPSCYTGNTFGSRGVPGNNFGVTTTDPFDNTWKTFGTSKIKPHAPTATTTIGDSGYMESISAMPINQHTSHEELRWLDYQLGDYGRPVGKACSCCQPKLLQHSVNGVQIIFSNQAYPCWLWYFML